MATTLALAMRASLSASGVVSGSNQASKAMDKMGKQAKQTARDVSTLKNIAIGAVVAKGIAAVGSAFSSAGRAALSMASSVAQSVDALNDLSDRTGIGVESLQSLQMAAKLSGVDDATAAVQKLGLAIGQAAESGKTDAFERLGLNFAQLQAMAPEEQFRAVQAAIAALPTPAERAAAAVAIFGKAGVELIPLMSRNLAEVEERMRRLGAIVGTDQVEAIGEMNDSLDMVKATFDGIIGQVVGNLAPVVTSLAEEFLGMVESFNGMAGQGGEGIANTITDAMLDIADYLAGVFDNAVAGFDGFGVTLSEVGAIFEFVGNVFTAVAETLRAGFNVFELAGNAIAAILGLFLEGLGSWISKDLEEFGKTMQSNAGKAFDKNFGELDNAAQNAVGAAGNAIFGGNASDNAADGPASRAVRRARERMTPESKAEREAARQAKEAEAKAAREAAAADAKAKKDAEDAAKRQEDAAKVQEKIDAKAEDIGKITAERQAALSGKSNESLKANDIRSSEGMSQYLALATGREDPAIAEYRKQTQKLEELKAELRALNSEKVEILGAAA